MARPPCDKNVSSGRRADSSCARSRQLLILATRALFAVAIGIAAIAGWVRPAAGETTTPSTDMSPTVQLLPSAIHLKPGERATLTLVVTNSGMTDVVASSIDVSLPPRLAVSKQPSSVGVIAAGTSKATSITITASSNAHSGKVVAEVTTAPRANLRKTRIYTAETDVSAETFTVPTLDAAFLDVPGDITDRGTALITLRVTNASQFRVTDVHVSPVKGDGFTVSTVTDSVGSAGVAAMCPNETNAKHPSGDACIDELARGQTVVVPMRLDPDNRFRPGKRHVLAVVTGVAVGGFVPSSARTSTTATTEFTLAVFGSDALLTPLGITVVLLIPGALAVLTFLFASRAVYPRKPSGDTAISIKDPQVMVFIWPISVAVFFAFWLLDHHTDLTEAYGSGDLLRLWLAGFVLGAVAWGAAALVYYYRQGRKEFRPDDAPTKVLKRLAARGRTTTVTRVASKTTPTVYCVLAREEDDTWVCPAILYRAKLGAGTDAQLNFRTAVESGDPGGIRAAAEDTVDLAWSGDGSVERVATEKLEIVGTTPLLTEMT
jgi:NPCBM-associated, NEW3 domain of alpha-galactosidase